MPDTTDLWYICLPDGRVLRAAGTAVVRQQLTAGRLPPGTRLMRSPDDDWRAVERWAEFADLARTSRANGDSPRDQATIASRLGPALLERSGVRGLLDELLAALDSTLVGTKLLAAVLAGLLLGGLAALTGLPWFDFGLSPPGWGWLLPAAALLVWSWLGVMLSRLAYIELSRLRPARWGDGLAGSVGPVLQLALAQGLLVLLLGGLIAAVRWLPGWLPRAGSEDTAYLFQAAGQAVGVAGMILEVLLWPALLLILPLGALVVVEGCSFLSALRRWCRLVWQRPGRLLLAEALALGVALLLAVPLGLLMTALTTRTPDSDFALANTLVWRSLAGLFGSVVLAYLVVANVFIYLHLHYER